MARFASEAELKAFLGKLDADYAEYAPALWQKGIKTPQQLANFSEPHYLACDIPEGHIDDIKARAGTTEPDIFACKSEFMDFFKYEGNADVAQWSAAAWDSGYRSIESIAHASEDELLAALGGAAPGAEHVYVFHSFCKARGVMATRAQLLSATVPMPDMSTSPSGIRQTETAKSCHPDSVAEMDIAPEVMEYISRLGVTPKRFKVVDYNLAHLPAREAAVERLWERGVLESTNSLTNYHFYSGENDTDACVYAYWQAQGSTTQTHSDIIDPQDIASQPSFRGEALLARHGAFEDAVVKNRDTYDYLLKTDPSRSSRVLSVVEVKRVERLCLLAPGGSIDRFSAPNLPAVWAQHLGDDAKVLKLNVEAVIAQVNAYSCDHGVRYGMISNCLWSWVFRNEGKNKMSLSQAFRYDAKEPTVLQVHAYVTYMSLKQPALAKWEGKPSHPNAAVVSTTPNRTRSQTRRPQQGVSKAGSGSQAALLRGHQSKGMKTKQLALFANASSLQPSRPLVLPTSAIVPQSPVEEAMSFQLCFVQRVLAEGTCGTVYIARTGAGGEMALKIASLGSSKHYSLQHQLDCLLRLKSLWGQCVPHVVLAGELTAMQHGYGLGTALIRGRHPRSGDIALLPMAEDALGQIHDCGVLMNDLHRHNVVITQTDNMSCLFFIDFSHATMVSPTSGQRKHEIDSLCAALGGPANS